MDYADDDAVRRFEIWEKALTELAWIAEAKSEVAIAASKLQADDSITRMKREAIINAARIDGDAHLARISRAFPGLDVPALVLALRVKVVEMRLEGRT